MGLFVMRDLGSCKFQPLFEKEFRSYCADMINSHILSSIH